MFVFCGTFGKKGSGFLKFAPHGANKHIVTKKKKVLVAHSFEKV